MTVLYIDHPGAKVAISGEKLVIKRPDGQKQQFPFHQIEHIMSFGQIHFSGAALAKIMKHALPTSFFSRAGFFRSRLSHQSGGQVQRRTQQYRVFNQPEEALSLAKALTLAKIRGQQRQLQEWSALKSVDPDVFPQLKDLMKSLPLTSNSQTLRGLEGLAAKRYFSVFPQVLESTAFSFPGRRRRPPPDPVNALLSFGYTLLEHEVTGPLELFGLDRFSGFYHTSDGHGPALALDLMDPLRIWVDRWVIHHLRHQHFTPDDFSVENGACRLTPQGRSVFFRQWSNMMQKKRPHGDCHFNRRQIIHQQTAALAAFLDKKTTTVPFFTHGRYHFPITPPANDNCQTPS
jgi:CRISP-associated protein Cas1